MLPACTGCLFFNIILKNPRPGIPAQGVILLGEGGADLVGAVFRSWALPRRFLGAVIDFFGFLIDFEWILGGFGEGFGGFWEGFKGISRLFFAFLSKIAIL